MSIFNLVCHYSIAWGAINFALGKLTFVFHFGKLDVMDLFKMASFFLFLFIFVISIFGIHLDCGSSKSKLSTHVFTHVCPRIVNLKDSRCLVFSDSLIWFMQLFSILLCFFVELTSPLLHLLTGTELFVLLLRYAGATLPATVKLVAKYYALNPTTVAAASKYSVFRDKRWLEGEYSFSMHEI